MLKEQIDRTYSVKIYLCMAL